jgi:hypothetical protein
LAKSLKENGVDTSDSALSRFLKKRRGMQLVENGKELAAAAEALAEQGRGGKLREGTLEVMRQQFFEKAAGGVGGEEAQVLYGALVAEEARVKELELEARKVAALEQQVRLQERRIEVEAMKAHAALGRVRAHVVRSKAQPGEVAEGNVKELGPVKEAGVGESAEAVVAAEETPANSGTPNSGENEKRLLEAAKRAVGILNRGGDMAERILEARELLAEVVRGLGAEGAK